mmetsp:Transcript_439/g.1219  ORF Transcript_439/g.1219 Transcript_439/m.1219 type:complete len:296 (+) Transcript_439:539-1426(+)
MGNTSSSSQLGLRGISTKQPFPRRSTAAVAAHCSSSTCSSVVTSLKTAAVSPHKSPQVSGLRLPNTTPLCTGQEHDIARRMMTLVATTSEAGGITAARSSSALQRLNSLAVGATVASSKSSRRSPVFVTTGRESTVSWFRVGDWISCTILRSRSSCSSRWSGWTSKSRISTPSSSIHVLSSACSSVSVCRARRSIVPPSSSPQTCLAAKSRWSMRKALLSCSTSTWTALGGSIAAASTMLVIFSSEQYTSQSVGSKALRTQKLAPWSSWMTAGRGRGAAVASRGGAMCSCSTRRA